MMPATSYLKITTESKLYDSLNPLLAIHLAKLADQIWSNLN